MYLTPLRARTRRIDGVVLEPQVGDDDRSRLPEPRRRVGGPGSIPTARAIVNPPEYVGFFSCTMMMHLLKACLDGGVSIQAEPDALLLSSTSVIWVLFRVSAGFYARGRSWEARWQEAVLSPPA